MNTLTRSDYLETLCLDPKGSAAQKCGERKPRVGFWLLRGLNTGTLALLLFVALALLPTTHGKDSKMPSGGDQSSDGYLQVYSATDQFDDGGTSYYAHSSYVVYTNDGKRFKTIANHISPSDETPDMVSLPAGTYLLEARSEFRGYVRLRVTVRPGRVTVVDLESDQALGQLTDSTAYDAYAGLTPELGRGKTHFAVLVAQAVIAVAGQQQWPV